MERAQSSSRLGLQAASQITYHDAGVDHERDKRPDVGVRPLTNDAGIKADDWPADLSTSPSTVVRLVNNIRRRDEGIEQRLFAYFARYFVVPKLQRNNRLSLWMVSIILHQQSYPNSSRSSELER